MLVYLLKWKMAKIHMLETVLNVSVEAALVIIYLMIFLPSVLQYLLSVCVCVYVLLADIFVLWKLQIWICQL